MSNIINLPPNEESGRYNAPSHENGGVQSIVDGVKKVEIEGDEYHLCKEVMKSNKVYHFKQKTNEEILQTLFQEANCVFEQGKSNSGDFIICKLVVLDEKKRDISGTPKEIVNIMQSEKSCRVSDDDVFGGGGGVSAKDALEERLEVLRSMQRRRPTKEIADKIRKLKKDIKNGVYDNGGSVGGERYFPSLIAVHGLSYSNILFADKLGGISMPSIAILDINSPITTFGDILLVAPIQLIDPETNFDAKIFNRDIYSPTYPKLYSYVDKHALRKLYLELLKRKESFTPIAEEALTHDFHNFIHDLEKGRHLPEFVDFVRRNLFLMYLYVKDKGVEIDIPVLSHDSRYWFLSDIERVYAFPVLYKAVLDNTYNFDNGQLLLELSELFKESYLKNVVLIEDEKHREMRLEKLKEYYDGNVLSYRYAYEIFKDLVSVVGEKKYANIPVLRTQLENVVRDNEEDFRSYVRGMVDKVLWGSYFFRTKTKKKEATLGNIYEYMSSFPLQGSEDTMTYGLGKAASLSAKQYGDLSAVARDKDHYAIDEDSYNEYLEKQEELWGILIRETLDYYEHENRFNALDNLSKATGELARKDNPTEDDVRLILNRNGFQNLPNYKFRFVLDFADCLRTAPSRYFEVKINGIVSINSFVAAIIPRDDNTNEVVSILNQHGISDIALYEKNQDNTLVDAIGVISAEFGSDVVFKNGGSVKTKKIRQDQKISDEVAKQIKGIGLKVYIEPTEDDELIGLHLPIEMAVYVPSTQDANVPVPKEELERRVAEVRGYLSELFGGFSSSDIVGGYVSNSGELIQEDIVKVISFATQESYDKNKEKLAKKIAEWGLEWNQEAIGFELEGDLFYINQN